MLGSTLGAGGELLRADNWLCGVCVWGMWKIEALPPRAISTDRSETPVRSRAAESEYGATRNADSAEAVPGAGV